MHVSITLRGVIAADIPIFYEHQRDPGAAQMAGFPSRGEAEHSAHWAKILADPANVNRTILVGGQVAGNIACFPLNGERLVGYWIGREFWGRGVASAALRLLLAELPERPLFAYVASHNRGSARVLAKCGFAFVGEDGEELKFCLAGATP